MNDRSTSSDGLGCGAITSAIVLFLSAGVWLTIQVHDRSEKIVMLGAMSFCLAFALGVIVWQFADGLWENRRWSGLVFFLPSVLALQVLLAWLLNGFSASPPFWDAAMSFGVVSLILAFGIYLLEVTGTVNILDSGDEPGKVEPEVGEVFDVMNELVLDEVGIDRNSLRQRFPRAQRNQFFDPQVTQASWDARTILVVAINNFVYQQIPPLFDDWFYQKARRLLMAALVRSRGFAAEALGKEPFVQILVEGKPKRRGCVSWLGWAIVAPLRLVWLAIRWVLTPLKFLLIPISLPLAIRASQRRIFDDFLLFHSVNRVLRQIAVESSASTQEQALAADVHRIRRAYEDAEHKTELKLFRAVIRALVSAGSFKAGYAMAVQQFRTIMSEEEVGSCEGNEEFDPEAFYKLASTWIRALEEALEEPEIQAWLVEFDQRFDQALAPPS